MTSECKYSTSFFHSQIKKKPYIPHKGPKGFGGTTLINTVPKCLHTVRSSSDNAGKTPYFNCTGLRGRFHNLRTESSHHTDSSLGLLLMYYSLHRHRYFAFGFILCEISGCVKGENPNVIPLLYFFCLYDYIYNNALPQHPAFSWTRSLPEYGHIYHSHRQSS